MSNIKEKNQEFIIYRITNLINKKSYVGITYDFKRRMKEHFDINRKKYISYIKNSIKKYGKNNFKVKKIDKIIGLKQAQSKEIYWIKKLNTKVPNGMNLTDGGEGSIGVACSEETRDKISKANKGKKRTQETKDKQSRASKGKKKSQKHKDNIAKSHIGIKNTKMARDKISKENKGKPAWNKGLKLPQFSGENSPRFGKKHTKEAKKKNSLAHTSKKRTKESIYKGIKSREGYKHIQETKDKIGKAHKGRKHSEQHNINNKKALQKLSTKQIKQIRKLIKQKLPGYKIAKLFNISKALVSRIKNKKAYLNIPDI